VRPTCRSVGAGRLTPSRLLCYDAAYGFREAEHRSERWHQHL